MDDHHAHDTISGIATFAAGSDGYRRATSPRNSGARQRPRLVAAPSRVEHVVAAVRHAAARGLSVVPQATGHGAAGELGDAVLLLDTSGLDAIDIDPERRVARVGAGARWGAVDAQAERLGLLGKAGSAPDVAVSGFTFGGGAGWLTRPYGLAAGSLIAVDYVDGTGAIRRAADDGDDEVDRAAIWAFRGGGGVGVAATLEFELEPVDDLWAGYLLWPVDALPAVVAAWTEALPRSGPALTTSIGVLHAPPGPPFPEPLRGRPVVHLAMASSGGEDDAAALRKALAAAPAPTADTWGAADAAKLSGIHLDPPVAVPALGMARWLDDTAPSVALDVLAAGVDGPVQMVELRNVANSAPARDGAMSTVLGAFMLHAVGDAPDPGSVPALEDALATVRRAGAAADVGLTIGSWAEGRAAVPDALPPDVRKRMIAVRARVDPDGVIAPSRFTSDGP